MYGMFVFTTSSCLLCPEHNPYIRRVNHNGQVTNLNKQQNELNDAKTLSNGEDVYRPLIPLMI